MSNNIESQASVNNINGRTPEQQKLVEKAEKILAVLKEEPETRLAAFLRYTEHGIFPDVRLVPVEDNAVTGVANDNKDNSNDTNESKEGNVGDVGETGGEGEVSTSGE